MKKMLMWVVLVALMLVMTVSYAQEVEYADTVGQRTIAWNAVAPIEPSDIITYRVYTDSSMAGIVAVGDTDLLHYTVIFVLEGEYILGVSAIREVAFPGFSEFKESDINWSNVDEPTGSTPNPFVLRWVKGINAPENLRLQ